MANLAINTTQNVNLDYKIASIGERILAFLIDIFLFILYFFILGIIISYVWTSFDMDQWSMISIESLLLLPVMFYSLYMHLLFDGRTIGKMILKIKVVKIDGTPVHWSNYLVRWMLRLVDIWIFSASVGVLSMILSDRKQRVGDAAAGTVVINTQRKVAISHTILEELQEDYKPTFTNVTQLTDKDIRLIKETYQIAARSNDYKTLNLLRKKIEDVLQTSSEQYDKEFIKTILKDYNYYTQQM